MEGIVKIRDLEEFDNLKDIMILKNLKLYYLPFDIDLVANKENYNKLNEVDKRFEKIDDELKYKYIGNIIEEMYIQYLRDFSLEYYTEVLSEWHETEMEAYFIYRNNYMSLDLKNVYKKIGNRFEKTDIKFDYIDYEEIEELYIVVKTIKKDLNNCKKNIIDIRSCSKNKVLTEYVSYACGISNIIDGYIESSVESDYDYAEEEFENWINFVDYEDFEKEYL